MTFRAAVVQDSPVLFNLQSTIEKVEVITEKASKNNAKLIVFPEAFLSAYPKGLDFGAKIGFRTEKGRSEFLDYYNSSLDLESKDFLNLLSIAKKNNIYMVIGVIEKTFGTLYCTVLHISDKGRLLCKHRKVMPTAAERIVWGFGDGSTIKVAKTSIGVIGSVICWENYMPMLRMAMYDQGIQLYCAPTADDRKTWKSTMTHIALEGRCFVFSACQHLTIDEYPEKYQIYKNFDNSTVMHGGSCIISPLGKTLCSADNENKTILYADIDLNEITKGKYDFDVVGHYSRPDIFSLAVNTEVKKSVKKVIIKKK